MDPLVQINILAVIFTGGAFLAYWVVGKLTRRR